MGRVYEFLVGDKPCPYIKDLKSETKYMWIESCNLEKYEVLLNKGWRRFGKLFFNPVCEGCCECLSMRIETQNYKLSRSQKRVLAKNKNTKLVIKRPSITKEHLNLYRKYHMDMVDRKEWDRSEASTENYYQSFVDGYNEFGFEFNYYVKDQLVGVALVDVLKESISAVYCYYDPDFRDYSIGTFSVLKQLELGKKHNKKYLYLGYWVRENGSLKYKSNFKPFEILEGRPQENDESIWISSLDKNYL